MVWKEGSSRKKTQNTQKRNGSMEKLPQKNNTKQWKGDKKTPLEHNEWKLA